MNLRTPPLLARLEDSQEILILGAGGGFDVFAGLPLYHHLKTLKKSVHLGSLSFSDLSMTDEHQRQLNCIEVDHESVGPADYFPEKYLAQWFFQQGGRVPIHCFSPAGSAHLLSIYQELVRKLAVDTVILVDGGTDCLMRGDEPSLGTPAEDMASIVAADQLKLPTKLLVSLGFGVDAFHGVCHAYVLEAMADLTQNGTYLGGLSLLPQMPEFQCLKSAVEFVHERMPKRKSIVMSSVIAAAEGRFGHVEGIVDDPEARLFINPLMSMYHGFELSGVAKRCLYRDYMVKTYSRWDVTRAIGNFLYVADSREWMELPF